MLAAGRPLSGPGSFPLCITHTGTLCTFLVCRIQLQPDKVLCLRELVGLERTPHLCPRPPSCFKARALIPPAKSLVSQVPGGFGRGRTSSGVSQLVLSSGNDEFLYLRGFAKSCTEGGLGWETQGPLQGGQEMPEEKVKCEAKARQGETAATWLTQPSCLLQLTTKEDVFTFISVKIRSGEKIYIK